MVSIAMLSIVLLLLATCAEVILESKIKSKSKSLMSHSERANQALYQGVARARKLRKIIAKKKKGIQDPADRYFVLNNKLLNYT